MKSNEYSFMTINSNKNFVKHKQLGQKETGPKTSRCWYWWLEPMPGTLKTLQKQVKRRLLKQKLFYQTAIFKNGRIYNYQL